MTWKSGEAVSVKRVWTQALGKSGNPSVITTFLVLSVPLHLLWLFYKPHSRNLQYAWSCQGEVDCFMGAGESAQMQCSRWQRLKSSQKTHGLDLQMRNGTQFEKSIGCHGIFMGPRSWQAFHSVNLPSFPTQLPEPVHDLCLPLLLTMMSKVAGYFLMGLSNSPWMFWDNGFCCQLSDTLTFSWVSVPSLWVESFRDCAL